MKKLKIVVLLAGLFAFTSVQAGEITVSGSASYIRICCRVNNTGNSLGMNTNELKFTDASGEHGRWFHTELS